MKKLFCCVVLSGIVFTSCKKDNSNPNEISVVGSWHLYSFGSLLVPLTPSDNIILTFDASGKYNTTTNAVSSEKGSYKLYQQQTGYARLSSISFIPDSGDAYTAIANRIKNTHVLEP